jgi:predicted MPP superfamily phosphohydrolase
MNTLNNSKPKDRISRRDFLKLMKVAGLNMLLLAFGGGYMSRIEPGWLEVTQVRLALPRLPKSFSGFRLVQISDIHMGGWMNSERLTHLLDVVMGLSPNLVAITGDFVLGHNNVQSSSLDMVELESALKLLTTRFPTMAVLGNHDYWLDVRAVLAMLERSGVQTLVDSVQKVQIGDEFIYIGGMDDIREGNGRINQVLAKLPAEGCAILMAHEPDFADKSAATGRFDLQISGHSHGGQVNLPFIGPPILPYMAHRYPAGLYQVGKMYQYTNRGAGMTPPYIRFNCRPEITVFTLESM